MTEKRCDGLRARHHWTGRGGRGVKPHTAPTRHGNPAGFFHLLSQAQPVFVGEPRRQALAELIDRQRLFLRGRRELIRLFQR